MPSWPQRTPPPPTEPSPAPHSPSSSSDPTEPTGSTSAPAASPGSTEPPTSPSSSASSLETAIRYEDRIFLTGATRSGKSTLARRLFLAVPGKRMVLDPVGSELTKIPGCVTFRDARKATNDAGQNWREATYARFVPDDPDDLDAYSDVYHWCRARPPYYVWCDEAGFVLPSSGGNRWGRRVLIAGAKAPVGHMACHTRPRNCDQDLVAQAQHVFMFLTPKIEDRRYLADNIGVPAAVLEAEHAQLLEHGCLWWNQRARTLTRLGPIG